MTERSATIAARRRDAMKKNSRRRHEDAFRAPPFAGRTSWCDAEPVERANSKRVFDHAAIAHHQPGVRDGRQLGVVRDEDDCRAAAVVNLARAPGCAGRSRCPDCRSARRRARSADCSQGRGRAPRAAAPRPTAARDSDARARSPTSSRSCSARGRASSRPAISIGTATFSYAVSDGMR